MKTATEQTGPAVPATLRRSLPAYFKLVVDGFLIGSSNVVPGVSGGTMAFILGIFEELIESLRMAGQPEFFRALLGLRIKEAWRIINGSFLAAIGLGVVVAVLTLAPGIEWMLVNQPVIIWSFFFGLVLGSVVLILVAIHKWTAGIILALLVGALGAYWLVGLVPVQTPETWWFLMFSGAAAICAMILPGISGSFLLVMLGKYEFFVRAVNNRDIIPIIWAGIGAAVGLVSFAQLLSWLFKRYHNATMAVLTGFMLGSLRKVWPWKETLETYVDRHGEVLPLIERNILPALRVEEAFNSEILFALIAGIVGLVAVLVIERSAKQPSTSTE